MSELGYEYLACRLCGGRYPLEAPALLLALHIVSQHEEQLVIQPQDGGKPGSASPPLAR